MFINIFCLFLKDLSVFIDFVKGLDGRMLFIDLPRLQGPIVISAKKDFVNLLWYVVRPYCLENPLNVSQDFISQNRVPACHIQDKNAIRVTKALFYSGQEFTADEGLRRTTHTHTGIFGVHIKHDDVKMCVNCKFKSNGNVILKERVNKEMKNYINM